MSSIDSTLAERGSRYGEFTGHAKITQAIKQAMQESGNWKSLPNDMVECLEMVAHKIGRILNGDPNYVDSWTDIIGYTRLVEKRLISDGEDQAKVASNPTKDPEEIEVDILGILNQILGGAAASAPCVDTKDLVAKSFGRKVMGGPLTGAPGTVSDKEINAALALLLKAGVIRVVEE